MDTVDLRKASARSSSTQIDEAYARLRLPNQPVPITMIFQANRASLGPACRDQFPYCKLGVMP
jgi:hypothetical protein